MEWLKEHKEMIIKFIVRYVLIRIYALILLFGIIGMYFITDTFKTHYINTVILIYILYPMITIILIGFIEKIIPNQTKT